MFVSENGINEISECKMLLVWAESPLLVLDDDRSDEALQRDDKDLVGTY